MKRLLIICVTGMALMLGGLIPAENAEAQRWGWRGYYRPGVSVYVGPRYRYYRPYYRSYAYRPYYRAYSYPGYYYGYPRYSRGFYNYGPYSGVYFR